MLFQLNWLKPQGIVPFELGAEATIYQAGGQTAVQRIGLPSLKI